MQIAIKQHSLVQPSSFSIPLQQLHLVRTQQPLVSFVNTIFYQSSTIHQITYFPHLIVHLCLDFCHQFLYLWDALLPPTLISLRFPTILETIDLKSSMLQRLVCKDISQQQFWLGSQVPPPSQSKEFSKIANVLTGQPCVSTLPVVETTLSSQVVPPSQSQHHHTHWVAQCFHPPSPRNNSILMYQTPSTMESINLYSSFKLQVGGGKEGTLSTSTKRNWDEWRGHSLPFMDLTSFSKFLEAHIFSYN